MRAEKTEEPKRSFLMHQVSRRVTTSTETKMANPVVQKKVCVIGAGAGGLCAARHLAADSKFKVTVYEQTANIGGTWVYTDRVGLDENGLAIHSSMYQNLRTNLPARIMNFPDYVRMESQEPSCITHREVLAYLHDYAEHFQLSKYIQFYKRVEKVRPVVSVDDDHEYWTVRIKSVKTQEVEELDFDAIMICNGHYFEPKVPTIPGMETFSGSIMHSHSYRKPDEFANKIVLILGAASSGIDIGIDLSKYASRVYLSHNNDRFTSPLPSNMIQVVGVTRVEGDIVFLKDGTSIFVNVFLYCTGYRYSFPFLDESCGIRVDDNHVTPLYKHLINIEHPTMAIVGIPFQVVPFPLFHMQILYFLAILKRRVVLPSKIDMLEDSKLKVPNKRHAHKLNIDQWDYNDKLADIAGFERLPPYYKAGYNVWGIRRKENLFRYKDFKFIVSEDGKSVQIVLPDI